MRVVVLFEPDETCTDPGDDAKTPRRHYDEIVPEGDALVVWREYGDQFKGGVRTHIVGSGIWENVTIRQVTKALRRLARVR